jgi:hypothetical protein
MNEFDCDFCKGVAKFERKSHKDESVSVLWWLEGIDGSGSDHLAIWCGTCGPKHREN